jgi:hypothetical protein
MGVSLAADSAVTFATNSSNGNNSATYSSGVNKIFQLTENEPVGVMIFNASSIQGVPWELIIKSFRSSFAQGSCAKLGDYKKELGEFIEKQMELFPNSQRQEELKKLIAQSTLIFLSEMKTQQPALLDLSKALSHATEWSTFLQGINTRVTNASLPSFFSAQDIADAQMEHGPWLSTEIDTYIKENPDIQHLSTYLADPKVVQLSIEGLFKFYQVVFGLNYTGLVIAGYGDNDFFPAHHQIRYYGFIGNKLVWDDVDTHSVGHTKPAVIQAFGMQSMVETFMTGIAPNSFQWVLDNFSQYVRKACEETLAGAGNIQLSPGALDTIIDDASKHFKSDWHTTRLVGHYLPLTEVIAGLTVEEMGELSETLVMLESLKEKVTKRTQSVGGPVDVAVITKSEGLVWIKRKHYFDPKLNHRYFARHK